MTPPAEHVAFRHLDEQGRAGVSTSDADGKRLLGGVPVMELHLPRGERPAAPLTGARLERVDPHLAALVRVAGRSYALLNRLVGTLHVEHSWSSVYYDGDECVG